MKKSVMTILVPLYLLSAGTFENYFYNVSGCVDKFLLVDKSKQKLWVVAANDSETTVVADSFRVTTGRVPGNKEKEGDLKTPEGIYRVVRKLNGDGLPEKYGPLAFVLDYPNIVDKLEKKNGSNIWIHGRNETIRDFQTEGCISLENGHILDLATYIDLNDTRIIILDSMDCNNPGWENVRQNLYSFFQNWKKNWNEGNLEPYFNCYSEDFTESGNSFQTFRERKRSLEKLYSWKKIEIDSLRFLISKREILASFIQTYVSPNFTSYGEKELVILRSGDTFKILREEFTRIGIRVSADEEIVAFLKKWQAAWEALDIESYMSFYSDKFSIEDKDISWFKSDKAQKFSKVRKVNLEISNISSHSSQVDHWVVNFRQVYEADNYKDVGVKTMIVEKQENGEFKILNEVWRRSK
ncbi:MAG: L,D-transpeptidase family protein [Candidatus Marinimicrobia bacterium]|nr:L,D-transpeptidase family protein [Candidatus Neomarinimicrobiota bacterium]